MILNEDYKQVLNSTYIALAQGTSIDVLEEVVKVYEEMEMFECCAAMMVAISQWEVFEGNSRVKQLSYD